MNIVDLIAIANEAYPDDMIAYSFNPTTGKAIKNRGDSLAYFIVQELIETFDEDFPTSIQLVRVIQAIHNAMQELTSVENRIQYALSMLDIPDNEVALHLTSESEPIKKLLEDRLKGTE